MMDNETKALVIGSVTVLLLSVLIGAILLFGVSIGMDMQQAKVCGVAK